MAKKKPPNAGKGRPAGSLNKLTTTIKMAMQESFDNIGGARWLEALAKNEPRTYAMLLAKIIPLQVVGDVTRPFVALIPAPSGTSEEWLKTYAHLASPISAPSATKH